MPDWLDQSVTQPVAMDYCLKPCSSQHACWCHQNTGDIFWGGWFETSRFSDMNWSTIFQFTYKDHTNKMCLNDLLQKNNWCVLFLCLLTAFLWSYMGIHRSTQATTDPHKIERNLNDVTVILLGGPMAHELYKVFWDATVGGWNNGSDPKTVCGEWKGEMPDKEGMWHKLWWNQNRVATSEIQRWKEDLSV